MIFFLSEFYKKNKPNSTSLLNQLLSTSTGIWQESGWNVCHFLKKSVSITYLTVSKSVLVFGGFPLMVFA